MSRRILAALMRRNTITLQPSNERSELLYRQLSQLERTARVGVLQLGVPDGAIWWSGGVPNLLGLPAGTPPDWAALRQALGEAGVATLRAAITAAQRANQELDIDLPLAGYHETPTWMRICGRAGTSGKLIEANAIIQDVSERRLIASQINQATAAERQRLLSDLHDNLGQLLASAGLLAVAHEREVRATAPTLAASAQQLMVVMVESQRLCRDLSHELMEDFRERLARVLECLAARTAQTGVGCSFRCSGGDALDLTEAQCRELFRIAQEAVTNALKHASSRRIELALIVDSSSVELSVLDDGVGIDLVRMVEGLGMRTMRYRAARLGTTVSVAPGEAGGTRVRLSVPRI